MTDNTENDKNDDVDWLRDAFDRAIQGDNGIVPDAARPAVNPFAGLTPETANGNVQPDTPAASPVAPVTPPTPVADDSRRHDLDLDFETENLPPVTAFEPVVPLDRPLPSVATDYPPTESLDAIDLPPTAIIEPAELAGDTSGIDQLDALFATSDTAAPIPVLSRREATAKAAAGDGTEAKTPIDQARLRKNLLLTIGGIAVAIVAIGSWVTGVLVATPPAPIPTATAEPVAPTATQPPGEYAFTDLYGGECLDPFDTAWADRFTVVDCETPHAAQLVYAGDLAADGAYLSYPGDSHVGKAALAECSRKGILNLTAAKAHKDLLISTAYPVNSEAWDMGDTRYYCFANLASGNPIEGDLAGSLMTEGQPTPEATASN